MSAMAAGLDTDPARASRRLVIACGLSLLLHTALLVGLPVNPTGGVPGVPSTIQARLETTTEEATSEAPAPAPIPEPSIEQTATPASEDPLKAPEPIKPQARPAIEPAPPTPSSPSAGIEVPLIRDPTYYTARELDVFPQPLMPVRLDYPERASSLRLDGHVRILLLIDEFGVVNEASVVEAAPPGYFEEAARTVFMATQFSPGMKQSRAVKSRVVVQVRYVYGETEAAARSFPPASAIGAEGSR